MSRHDYGDVLQKWVVFCKKSLNMSHFFHEKIPNYGSYVKNFMGYALCHKILKIRCVFVANRKKWVPFYRKIPKYGYLFLEKITPEHGYGS